ncbi:MAG: 1-deoxy-D-xylulose-5-phosphate reductoisomerase [Pseudomonadota bacterium]|nr:1-deoxy-D-xylulose-5-phosphate reductoisomerase [Pseudomonadota bacterium]
MKKNIVILGSTGSIGVNAIDVIKQYPEKFNVIAISTNQSIDLIIQQAKELKPNYVCVKNKEDLSKISNELSDPNLEITFGEDSLAKLSQIEEADYVLNAIVGSAGLKSSMNAVKSGKKLLLANKEPLVMCGDLLMGIANDNNAIILPIDSEHNAIHQCIESKNKKHIKKIVLTASGGPFLKRDLNTFNSISVKDALKHPTWKMGNKITVDCATMVNKGLEIIEAMHLFEMPSSKVEAIIHPQSLIHSCVFFNDNSVLTQMSISDMRIPIAYCLAWPDRIDSGVSELSLEESSPLNFEQIEEKRYPSFFLTKKIAEEGGIYPCILNAANEIAVKSFIEEKIKFLDIHTVIEKTVSNFENSNASNINEVLEYDKKARLFANNLVNDII